jgi:hypothetical protein
MNVAWFWFGLRTLAKEVICTPFTYNLILSAAVPFVVSTTATI